MAENIINGLNGAITALTIKHKKQIIKTKVKERGKRLLTAIPFVGRIAVSGFEKQQYDEWKQDNSNGIFEEYSDEIITATSNVAGEITDSYCADLGEACEGLRDKLLTHQP